MKVRYRSGAPSKEFTGLGTINTNEWVEVSKKAADAFQEAHGKTLQEAGFEVEMAKKNKEED
jgi:hypothetical protein